MNHYVIIDGQLQRSSPETKRWSRRAAKEVPKSAPEDMHENVQYPKIAQNTDWEIIESLEEHE